VIYIYQQEAQLSLWWTAVPPSPSQRPASNFRTRKKTISHSIYSPVQVSCRCYIKRYNQGYDTLRQFGAHGWWLQAELWI